MSGPFIVAEGMDLMFFPTLEMLAKKIEAVDVMQGVYRGFDAEGHRLWLTVDDDGSRNAVRAEALEGSTSGASELRELLLEFLAATESPAARTVSGSSIQTWSDLPLEALVKEALRRGGWAR